MNGEKVPVSWDRCHVCDQDVPQVCDRCGLCEDCHGHPMEVRPMTRRTG